MAIRWVGYNMMHGAANEVANSLKMVAGITKETGTVMVDWNAREKVAVDATALAYQRYATTVQDSSRRNIAATESIAAAQRNLELVTERSSINQQLARNAVIQAELKYLNTVTASNKLVVNAAHDQAIAWQGVEAAKLKVIDTTYLQAQAESDLALIASRAYAIEQDRIDLNAAANDRLATALGMRAVAEQEVAAATNTLISADTRAAAVISGRTKEEELAAGKISVAYGKVSLAASIAADSEIAALARVDAAFAGQATAAELSAARIAASTQMVNAALTREALIAQEKSAAMVLAFRNASAMAMGVGTGFLIAGTAVGVGMLYAAAKAGDLTSQIILLHTQARVATDQLPVLRAGVLGMAGDVGFAAGQLANALYLIESQGAGAITAAHALDQLRAAAMGAAVGHSDLTQTTRALAAVMQVFPGSLPIAAMGALDAIVGQGMMTMEDLNAALRTGILATLKSSGVTLADFGGALATMTDYAIPATQAANSLRMAIYLMTAPTQASDKVLKQFGLTTAEVSSASQAWTDKLAAAGIRHAQLADDLRKPNGLIVAMEDLRSHLVAAGLSAEGQAEVIYKAFGGGKMGKAVITLYENISSGSKASVEELKKLGFTTAEIATLNDRLITKTAAVNAQSRLLGSNFALLQSMDPAQMWKDLTAAVNALWLAFGTAFIPVLIAVLQFITPIVQAMTRWVAGHEDLVRVIGVTIVALLSIFGAALIFVGVLGSIAGSILAIGAASEFIIPAVAIFFGMMTGIAGLMTAAVGLAISVWGYLSNFWDTRVVPSAQRLWNIIGSVWTVIQQGLSIVRPIFDAAFGSFASRLTEQGGLWDNATLAFQDWTKSIIAWIKSPEFATLIADFSVALPAAIGLALDSLLLFGDQAQASFTLISATAEVMFYTMTGQFSKIPGVIKDTFDSMKRIQDRSNTDILKASSDFGKLFDGTYQNMWQQVYNNTMDATSKIGTDGAINLTTSGQKLQAANEKMGIHLKPIAYRTFYDVGANMTQGVNDGITAKQAALDAKIAKLVGTTVPGIASRNTSGANEPPEKGISGRNTAGITTPPQVVIPPPKIDGWLGALQTLTNVRLQINAGLGLFTQPFNDVFNTISARAQAFWTEFQASPAAAIGGLAGSILGSFLILRSGINQIFSFMVSDVTSFIPHLWDAYVAGTNGPQALARTATQNFVNSQAALLQQSIMNAVNWGKQTYSAFTGWAKGIPGVLGGYLSRAGDAIIIWMQNTRNSIVSGWNRITSWITTEWTALPKQAKTLGENIVKGIWDGISSLGNWLNKQGSDFFNNFMKYIKKPLGITSPSKLFALEIGQPIVQGVWMGAQSQQPMLQTNFGRMIAELSGAPVSINLMPNMMMPSSPSFQPLPLHSIQSVQRTEQTHIYEPSAQKQQPIQNTVHAETKVKLMLDDKVLAEAIDKKVYKTLLDGLSV